jgi:hypothetical protein
MKMVKLTGGGIQGSKVVQSKSAGKVEPKAKAVNPASTAQLGMSVQFKKPNLEMGPGYTPKSQGATGIAGARQGPSGAAPGGMGRTIFPSGSQSPTPPAREMPAGRGFDERPNKGKGGM